MTIDNQFDSMAVSTGLYMYVLRLDTYMQSFTSGHVISGSENRLLKKSKDAIIGLFQIIGVHP